MAKTTSFRIPVAYAADEQFAALIRHQTGLEQGLAPGKTDLEIECNFGKSNWAGCLHLSEKAAAPRKITSSE